MSDLHGYYIEDLEEGMSKSFSKTITEADITSFAGVSGDTKPVHLDEDFASQHTQFGGRIAHGMLSASFISTVVGTKLPGPGCIYVSQNLKFRAPVRAGDTVVATATVRSVNQSRKRVTLDTVCRVGDVDVIRGEAVMMVPSRVQLQSDQAA